MKRSIASEWDKFVALVMPADAPQLQRVEMRRAFYAGVESCLRMQWDIGDEKVSEGEGMAMLQAWSEECQAFGVAVQQGRA